MQTKKTVQIIQCDYQYRLRILITILEKNKKKAIQVLLSSNKETNFLQNVIQCYKSLANINIDFSQETKANKHFDLIIQFGPNKNITYHDNFVIFVQRLEYQDLEKELTNQNIKPVLQNFNVNKLLDDQPIKKLIENNFYIYNFAYDAFQGFVKNYQEIYQDLQSKLNLYQVAQMYGFDVPPKVINLPLKKKSHYIALEQNSLSQTQQNYQESQKQAQKQEKKIQDSNIVLKKQKQTNKNKQKDTKIVKKIKKVQKN